MWTGAAWFKRRPFSRKTIQGGMDMRSRYSLMLAGLALASAFALPGCGGGSSESTDAAANTATGGEAGDAGEGALRTALAEPVWVRCAVEGANCSFSGTQDVRYGLNGAYVYKKVAGGIACTNEAFGSDPLPGADKVCDRAAAPEPAPAPVVTWTRCALEDGRCTFSGTKEVRYGAQVPGQSFMRFSYRIATGGIDCNNNVFGDPVPGADKACDVKSVSTASAPKVVIEYYGDSTVWGFRSGDGGQVAQPAPAAFAEALPNPASFDVRNEGVSGSTACGLLNGTDGKHPAWSTQMANSKASYVLVNHAINDQWQYDLATYRACLASLARTAKQHGKKMVFETPNPTRDSGAAGLDLYAAAMRQVAAQEQVPVIDQYANLTAYLNGRPVTTICPDGLHPTQEVYTMKGRFAAQRFRALFIGH